MKKIFISIFVSFVILSIAINPQLFSVKAASSTQIEPPGEGVQTAPVGTINTSIEVVNPYFTVEHYTLADGTGISRGIINGPPEPPPGFEAEREASIMPLPSRGIISGFPSYDWVFGCSAVSGAMIAAHYDRGAYPNIYAGPTNGGVMPITDTSWPTWSDGSQTYPNNPLIASKNGVDGRAERGSIDNYWVQYLSTANDPYITNSWPQHAWSTAIGDYMKTSQSAYDNVDGSTSFYNWILSSIPLTCADMVGLGIADDDGTYGRKLFYEARGYTVTDCYSQLTDNDIAGGFSLADFQDEIDAGHPVLLNVEGHSMVGYGYSGSTIYIRNTWDSDPDVHYTMPWGGSYLGMELYAVSVVRLYEPNQAPTDINLSRAWVAEGRPVNTVVGSFSTVDPNLGDSHTYTLATGAGDGDNGSFNISGNNLRTSAEFDKATKDTYTIRVRSADQGGLYVEKPFTITVTEASAGGEVFLPLILKSGGIINGGFELGAVGWTQYSAKGWTLILHQNDTPVDAHGGNYLAWLGGDYDETSRVSQAVPISPSQPNLHFWYWIASEDGCGYDYARVKINGTTVKTFNLCFANNTGGWTKSVVSLSGYAGSTVTVMFEVTTDDSLNSNFFLDDVSLSSSATFAAGEPAQGGLLPDVTLDKQHFLERQE